MSASMLLLSKFPTDPGFPPVISEDNAYLVYISQSSVILRSMKSLATYKIISLPEEQRSSTPQIKLSPDNKMIGILFPERNSIRVIRLKDDVESTIMQLSVEDIANFEWLNLSQNQGNDYIMAVYSKCGLSVRLYSIKDSNAEVIHTIYKYSSQIIEHPILNQYTIALKSGIKNRIFTFTITDNQVQQVGEFELKDNSSDIIFKHSPLNSWILVCDALSGGLNVGVYNFLGLGKLKISNRIEVGYAFQSLASSAPSLGITTFDWALNGRKEEIMLFGDNQEKIYMMDMRGSLKVCKIFTHSSTQNNEIGETVVFEAFSKTSSYNKKIPALFKLPSNENLPLFSKGISELKVSPRDSKLLVVTKSMPTVIFLWDLENSSSPLLIINTQANIISTTLGSDKIPRSNNKYINAVIDSIIIINNGTNITIYSAVVQDVPMMLDVGFESKILGFSLDDVTTDNGEVLIKITCWSKNEIRVFTQSLSASESQSGFDEGESVLFLRQGSSPMTKEETDTNARRLINDVQQSEWMKSSSSILENGDTFMNKKRKITGKENEITAVAKKLRLLDGNVKMGN